MGRLLIATAAVCTAFLLGWHLWATATLGLGVIAFHAALVATIVMAGRMIGARLAEHAPVAKDLPAVLLLGLLGVHVGLLLLKCLPLPPTAAPCMLFVILCGVFVRDRKWREHPVAIAGWPLAATALALLAATLWSMSGFDAVLLEGTSVLFRPWIDAFYHSTWISAFAQAHGLWGAEHNLLADVSGEVYSFGDYLLPGELVALTGARAYDVTNALWVPLGLFAAGGGAYLLAASWWTARAGFGAVVCVMCVPDASSYFMQNELFGYHWVNVIGAGGAWGIAAAAVAVFGTETFCRSGARLAAAIAGLAAVLTFFFKAQIFLGLVPLIVLIKVVGLRRYALRWRLLGLGSFAGLLLAGPLVADALMPGLALRLDGSGAKPWLRALAEQHQGSLESMAAAFTETSSRWSDAAVGAPYLLLATFGPALLLIVIAGLVWQWRTKHLALASLFPVALLGLYLVLTLGLAANETGKHSPEALVHHPFVWYYFGLAAWAGGFVVDFLGRWQRAARLRWPLISSAVATIAAALTFVAIAGPSSQHGPSWSTRFCDQRVDRGLVDCAAFLREHSPAGAVVQDARGDPLLVLAALSERKCYWMTSHLVGGSVADRERRVKHVAALLGHPDAESIAAIAEETGIDWLVLHPDDVVGWPAEAKARAAFASQGYAVHRLR